MSKAKIMVTKRTSEESVFLKSCRASSDAKEKSARRCSVTALLSPKKLAGMLGLLGNGREDGGFKKFIFNKVMSEEGEKINEEVEIKFF